MRNFQAMLTCRSCGRQRRESDFVLGMKCIDCVRRDEFRKAQAMERKASRFAPIPKGSEFEKARPG
jgi:hypothetical protein